MEALVPDKVMVGTDMVDAPLALAPITGTPLAPIINKVEEGPLIPNSMLRQLMTMTTTT
jgi:hypothetical protein